MFSGVMNYAASWVNRPKPTLPNSYTDTEQSSNQPSRMLSIGYSVVRTLGKATISAGTLAAKASWAGTKLGARVGWETARLTARTASTVASAGIGYLASDNYSSTDDFVDAITPEGEFLSVEEYSAREDIEKLLKHCSSSKTVRPDYLRELARLLKKYGSGTLAKALKQTQEGVSQRLPTIEKIEAYSGLIDIVKSYQEGLSRGQTLIIRPAVDKLRKNYGDEKMRPILEQIRAEYVAKGSMIVERTLERYKHELACAWSGNNRGL